MKKIPKKEIALSLAILIMLIPSLETYSSVGNYSSKSTAINANRDYTMNATKTDKVFFPAAVAAVGIVVGVVVAVIGVIDGWNSIHPQAIQNGTLPNYDPTNFSKFDI